jgi:hypothetical protein
MSYYDSEDQGHEYDDYFITEKEERKRMTDSVTVYAKGRLFWPKIVGEKALHQNYERTGREWSYEFEPEDTSFLKEERLLDRLKDKEDSKNPDKGPYLNLRKPEFSRDGEKNECIRIYNENDEAWGDTLIGNGTTADVKLRIVDYGKGKKKGIYTTAIRITGLVPYSSNEFAGMDGGDTPKKPSKATGKSGAAKSAADIMDDLDDDIPF